MEWALLILDNEALTRACKAQLDALRADIQTLERQISDHDQFDLPAFRQWESLVCADLLSRKREAQDIAQLLRARLRLVHALRERGGYHEGEALFWFTAIESGRCVIPAEVERFWREIDQPQADDQSWARKTWTVAGDGSESAHDEPGGAAGGRGHGFSDRAGDADPDEADFSDQEDIARAELREDVGTRVKKLYRKIVRRLHPDARGLLSRAELELWHQTQAAYHAGDVFTLEVILARCDRVGTKQLRYSELLELASEARARLAMLERALVILAERRSWRFRATTASHRRAVAQELRNELEAEIFQLQCEQQALDRRLLRMQQEAERWMERRRRQMEEGAASAG
ncbi:MAG: hypothetical protein JO015_14910 [Verrucomicrobia bacterium]|nr:hypothetical protein [Verrucomicrobiota bacterium]